MTRCARYAALFLVVLALVPGREAPAHETETSRGDATAGSAPAAEGDVLKVAATVDPDAPGVVRVPLGARVRLTVHGAGGGTLHLHGYDLEVEAVAGSPAVLALDATHAGRFPLEMHVACDLLGRCEKAVLYLEVRAP